MAAERGRPMEANHEFTTLQQEASFYDQLTREAGAPGITLSPCETQWRLGAFSANL